MAIIERQTIIYHVRCDNCNHLEHEGAWSGLLARQVAERKGWQLNSHFNGLEWYSEHLCPDCVDEREREPA